MTSTIPSTSTPECKGCTWALGDRCVSGCTPLAFSVLGVLGAGLGSSRYHFGLTPFGQRLNGFIVATRGVRPGSGVHRFPLPPLGWFGVTFVLFW